MKTYEVLRYGLPSLTSTLDAGEWSASYHSHVTPSLAEAVWAPRRVYLAFAWTRTPTSLGVKLPTTSN
jgi:hypothetical protein